MHYVVLEGAWTSGMGKALKRIVDGGFQIHPVELVCDQVCRVSFRPAMENPPIDMGISIKQQNKTEASSVPPWPSVLTYFSSTNHMKTQA